MDCEPFAKFSKPSEYWTVCCRQLEFGSCRRSGLCRPTQTRNRRCKLAICHHRLTKYSCGKLQHARIEITTVSLLPVTTDSSSDSPCGNTRSSGKVHAWRDHINFAVSSVIVLSDSRSFAIERGPSVLSRWRKRETRTEKETKGPV